MTSWPWAMPALQMLWIAAFIPGESPPDVNTPMRIRVPPTDGADEATRSGGRARGATLHCERLDGGRGVPERARGIEDLDDAPIGHAILHENTQLCPLTAERRGERHLIGDGAGRVRVAGAQVHRVPTELDDDRLADVDRVGRCARRRAHARIERADLRPRGAHDEKGHQRHQHVDVRHEVDGDVAFATAGGCVDEGHMHLDTAAAPEVPCGTITAMSDDDGHE